MMRVDLPAPLAPGADVTLRIARFYKINHAKLLPIRTGYEYFESVTFAR